MNFEIGDLVRVIQENSDQLGYVSEGLVTTVVEVGGEGNRISNEFVRIYLPERDMPWWIDKDHIEHV